MEETKMPLVVMNRLSKTYGATRALNEVSLRIPEGRIIGVLGPNGCGKTTMMKILAGLIPQYQGSVFVGGEMPSEKTKEIVSFLPDMDFLPGNMNTLDAITYMRTFYGDFDENTAYQMLQEFALDPAQKLKTMSKGMREKVQLILTMSRRARLYLLDEPLGGIDLNARDAILNSIMKNHQSGSTLMISTHLIHDVERIFDDVILLDRGQVLSYHNVADLTSQTGNSLETYFKEVFRNVW